MRKIKKRSKIKISNIKFLSIFSEVLFTVTVNRLTLYWRSRAIIKDNFVKSHYLRVNNLMQHPKTFLLNKCEKVQNQWKSQYLKSQFKKIPESSLAKKGKERKREKKWLFELKLLKCCCQRNAHSNLKSSSNTGSGASLACVLHVFTSFRETTQ